MPDLPEGWRLDPDVHQELEHIGAWWVITDTGARTAWNPPGFEGNANNMICPVCSDHPEVRGDCLECKGRGRVDSIPYAPRPWDLIVQDPRGGPFGGLWLGGIHCQFGGVATGPGMAGTYKSDMGNCFPADHFDVVLSMLTAPPAYDPHPEADHHVYRIADADLDPEHHTHIDYLADKVATDVRNGKRVLVRCQAGLNRSSLIVGLVLMREYGLSADEAIVWIRENRSPYALFNESFVAYLREVEARAQT